MTSPSANKQFILFTYISSDSFECIRISEKFSLPIRSPSISLVSNYALRTNNVAAFDLSSSETNRSRCPRKLARACLFYSPMCIQLYELRKLVPCRGISLYPPPLAPPLRPIVRFLCVRDRVRLHDLHQNTSSWGQIC